MGDLMTKLRSTFLFCATICSVIVLALVVGALAYGSNSNLPVWVHGMPPPDGNGTTLDAHGMPPPDGTGTTFLAHGMPPPDGDGTQPA
jgi:hypothetical protein